MAKRARKTVKKAPAPKEDDLQGFEDALLRIYREKGESALSVLADTKPELFFTLFSKYGPEQDNKETEERQLRRDMTKHDELLATAEEMYDERRENWEKQIKSCPFCGKDLLPH